MIESLQDAFIECLESDPKLPTEVDVYLEEDEFAAVLAACPSTVPQNASALFFRVAGYIVYLRRPTGPCVH